MRRNGGLLRSAGRLSIWPAGLSALLAWSLAVPLPAAAAGKEDRVYTVGNYPVEAKASNAVAAKTQAIADAQQAAFRSLLKRIVPVNSFRHLSRLRATKATNLIEGFSVRSERNSSTEYIATYDFTFQAEAVRRLLDREGIPFLDRQAPVVTVIPLYRGPADPNAPEMFTASRGSDAWLYAWKGLDLANSLTPLTLKALQGEVHPDTLKALLQGDGAAVRTLAAEYQSDTVLLAYLEPDLPQKKVKVTLAGRDSVAPFVLHRAYRLDGPDLAYTAELAAVISLGVLEGRWKSINVREAARGSGAELVRASPAPAIGPEPIQAPGPGVAEAGADGAMKIVVEFRSMAEWQQISRQLSATPEIADLDVEGLSPRGARVSLRYPGGHQGLAIALAQQGLILQNGTTGWVLRQR